MNFSAETVPRKWAIGSIRRQGWALVAVAALALPCAPASPAAKRDSLGDLRAGPPPKPWGTVHEARVPLPRPRPVQAPKGETPTTEPGAAQAPQPSACRLALTEEIAIAPSIADVHGPGGCGGVDLVRLEAVLLGDGHRVAVTPPATLRCAMAAAIADWVRTDVASLAARLGSEPSDLDNFDSFECRGRNRVAGAQLSEHGRANALDVRAIKLASGRSIALTDRSVPRELRESLLHSVCARFPTVLGPGSDWYHEDHIHLDLAERRNNYRICEWEVWDPLPQVAPQLPAERPDDAPPRAEGKAKSSE